MKPQVISFRCVLKNQLGQVLSTTVNHDVLTSVQGQEGILTGLARGLCDLQKGEERTIRLSASEAYGFYDPEKVIRRAREELPDTVRTGDLVPIRDKQGSKNLLRVVELSEEAVVLDGNHPFAGQDLVFEIFALEAREATDEEIAVSLPEPSNQLLH